MDKKGQNFKFYGFILSERYIGSTKNFERTFKGCGKFWGKVTLGSQFRPQNNRSISLKLARGVKISNFVGLFFLKGTLVQPKTVIVGSSCDTERPWKVFGETDSWFPIQLRKKWMNFLEAGESNETSNDAMVSNA